MQTADVRAVARSFLHTTTLKGSLQRPHLNCESVRSHARASLPISLPERYTSEQEWANSPRFTKSTQPRRIKPARIASQISSGRDCAATRKLKDITVVVRAMSGQTTLPLGLTWRSRLCMRQYSLSMTTCRNAVPHTLGLIHPAFACMVL